MKKLLLIGGDRRAACLAERLEQDGFQVETLGLGKNQQVHMDQADAVLFPYPFSVRGGQIPALTEERIRPEEVLDHIRKDTLVIAQRGMEGYLPQDSFTLKRYTDAAGFEKRNAELSAEAALFEAMRYGRRALMDSTVLITGYGLFGRALALRLKAMEADVWIAARSEQQRARAIGDGMHAVSIAEMADVFSNMNLIFNTVPARVFDEYQLGQIPATCMLLELASAPYGFDMDTARAMGILCELLPGLPAQYSPMSAAMALQKAVCELLGRYEK